jgi:hypothetical protein
VAQQTLDFVIAQQVTGQAEVAKLINSVGALDAEMKKLRAATAGMSGGFNQAAQAIRGNTNVLDAQSKALRNSRQGMQMAGMQVNDFVTSVSTGASPVQAFSQQIGQLGYAMSLMGGVTGRIGAFLAGPWSIAVIGATMVLGPLIDGLFGVSKEGDKTKTTLEQLEAITQDRVDSEYDVRLALAKTSQEYRNIQVEMQNTILQSHKLMIARHNEAMQNLALARAERDAIRGRAAEMAKAAGGGRGAAEAGAIYAATGTGQAKVEAMTQALIESTALLEKSTTRLNAARVQVINTDKRIASESERKTRNQDREADKLDTLTGKFQDYARTYLSASKQIGETANKLADFNELVADIGKLAGGQAFLNQFAAQITAIRNAIEQEGAQKALEKLNAEIDKLLAKELSPFEQRIRGVMEALGDPELTQLPLEDYNRMQEALASAAGSFFDAAEEDQRKLLAQAMEVDDSFKQVEMSLLGIIARSKELGLPIEGYIQQLERIRAINQEIEIVEKNKEIQRSYEAIGQAVSDGFKGMITGAQSFGDAMKGIINAVIEELFRLFVVQQIVGMVSKGLSSLTGIQLPARAMGGSVGQNKPYLVGERGPEIFVPGKSGTVIPTQNSHVAGSGGSVINVSVDARGATSPEMVRQQVQQGILEAAPSIVAAAEQRTITTLRRPRLAGAL